MRQSTVTFGVILFAFIVYITVRGQLPSYLALFKSKRHATITVTGSDGTRNSSQSDASQNIGLTVAEDLALAAL